MACRADVACFDALFELFLLCLFITKNKIFVWIVLVVGVIKFKQVNSLNHLWHVPVAEQRFLIAVAI